MNVPYVLLSTPKKRTKSPVCGLSPVVCFLPQNSLSFRHAKKSIFLLEDSIKTATPTDIYKKGPYLEHGRIESRICRIYRGEELIVDREKWNGNLTVVEILTATEKKV